jgi:putative ATPase
MESVKNTNATIPSYLQDAHYGGSGKLGRGVGYEYAHDYPKHFSKQRYLPEELGDTKFYNPSENGYERQIRKYLDWLHEDR